MYAKGMTTRDISTHLKDVYGVDASAEMISHMTDRILPVAKEWQNRPLERKYAIVFMDAVHFHVREDNRTVKKAVYVAIGVKLNGMREVLGMWVGGNESAKYWLGVLNEIKNRGVEDIMIVSVDGLTGFGEAIHAVFPYAEIQRIRKSWLQLRWMNLRKRGERNTRPPLLPGGITGHSFQRISSIPPKYVSLYILRIQ